MTKRDHLERQHARIERRITYLERAANRCSWLRLTIAIITIALSILLFNTSLLGWIALLIGGTSFAITVALHRRYTHSLTQFMLLREITIAQIARLTFRWGDLPPAPPHELPVDHPYAADLDLLGERSLLHLIDTTIVRESSDRLRDWLLTPPDTLSTSRSRQALVRELVPLTTFRRRLTLNASIAAGTIKQRWTTVHIINWLKQPGAAPPLAVLIVTALLAAANGVLIVLEQIQGTAPYWVFTLAAYAFVSVTQLRTIFALQGQANTLLDSLRQLSTVMNQLETYHARENTTLQALLAPFHTSAKPSKQLRRITGIVSAASLQHNPLVWIILNTLVPWDIFFAYLLGQLKGKLADTVPTWLDSWFTLEASSALADFAALHPENVFPTLTDEFTWHGDGLRHPLIAAPVKNDFSFARLGDIGLITGSNMSGKSSFLRTLGVNMVMAYAGGSVSAEAFAISHFRLFTQMRVSDSIADGYSYFYAEVRRLARLLKALENTSEPPLVFLIDEIFRGTNNRERLIGSRSYIRTLAGKRGIGLIATHDLDLTILADTLEQVRNYHFEDHVIEGQMTFDYTLREGASTSTNALTIMRQVGLPVEDAF